MVIIADTHIGDAHDTVLVERPKEFPHLLPMVDSRTLQTLVRMDEALDFAENSDRVLIIAGDIFDVHRPYPWAVAEFERFLLNAKRKDVEVHVIPGNHDSDAFSYATETFIPTDLCHVHNDIELVRVGKKKADMEVLFYPHVNGTLARKYGNKLEDVLFKKAALCDMMVSHGTPRGMPDGFIDEELSRVNIIDPADFKNTLVVLGHHHGPLDMTATKTKGAHVVIPGSVSITSFDHWEDSNGFVTVGGVKSVAWVPFEYTTVPYLQLDLKVPATPIQMEKALKTSAGSLLKLVVHAKKRSDVNEAELRTMFSKANLKKFEVRLAESERVSDTTKIVRGVTDPEKLLSGWLDRHDDLVPSKKVKTLAYQHGSEIIEQVVKE